MVGDFKFSKHWAIQAGHDEVKPGEVIVVTTQAGPKRVRVTDVVVRSTRAGKVYDLLFTEDVTQVSMAAQRREDYLRSQ